VNDRRPRRPERRNAPAPPPASALHAEAVAKDYGDRPALTPLDLTVGTGQDVVLIGHNGSGKTTFLRIAAGLLDATSGTVLIERQPSGSIEARRHLSYLGDTPSFYDDLSVWEHLEYVAKLHDTPDWEQRAADLLGHLGIYERADDLPTRFSRGMRQKASIALAFVRPFSVLLVDEPFVGLDMPGRAALVELLESARSGGATTLVATHELGFAQAAQRVVALREGEKVFDGDPSTTDLETLV
jgi:ABC-type multidrug transport system ATPase subunit